MRRTRATFAFVMIGIGPVLAACSGAGGSAGLAAVTDTVEGVPRYTYPAEGGSMLPWRADTTALIGEAFSDEDVYQFDRVPDNGLAGDAQGNVYVLDVAGSRVLSFDREGVHRATFGRKGEGPGELQQPFGIGLGAADTVWVLDPVNTRFTGYPQSGADPRVVTLTGVSGFPAPAFAVRSSGFVIQTSPPIRLAGGGSFRMGAVAGRAGRRVGPPRGGRAAPPIAAGDDTTEVDHSIPILRIGFDGAAGTTVWRSVPPEMNTVQAGGGDQVMVIAMRAAFTPTLRWAAFDDGSIVVSDKDRYELSLVATDGAQRMIIARAMAPWPVTETEREHARQQVRERQISIRGMNIDMSAMIEQQIQAMTFAETVPRIADLAVDQQDRIWVGVSLTTPGEVDRVDLYSKDGEFLGSLAGFEVPAAFFPDGSAASLFRDPDTDVQRVAVYRITEETPR
ncbi:MAG: hypothetical protein ACREL7_12965 [Longimicrobiales bacterium]